MPLHPNARAFIDQLQASGMPPLTEMPVADARKAIADLFAGQTWPVVDVKTENRRIPGPSGEIPVRIYRPAGDGPFPALVYLHGGGWVLGDLDAYDGLCRTLAAKLRCVVVSVDYRLAPEHRFPNAPEDCYAAARWVAENAASLGIDPGSIAVGGDSAGGNLAAVVALMARDRGGPRIAYQILVYPVTERSFDTGSYRDNGADYFLTTDMMIHFWKEYLSGEDDAASPYASPLRAKDLKGLPPALVITAEFDPLRDEGETYAKRLEQAGVPVRVSRYDGMIHGFYAMPSVFPQALEAIEETADWFRGRLKAAAA